MTYSGLCLTSGPPRFERPCRRKIILLHREPTPTGYRVAETRRRGERLSPASFPDLDFAVDDILG